jgi:4-amino-4-deoxy-L-arabinose transferase-like glycosyltransferase
MKVNKINIKKIFIFFLLLHLTIWTLIPGVSNHNLPLDTIEALAWGSSLDWGFNKHPPLSAFAVELIYQIFGSKDWAYYFLSQLFVILSFFIVFKFSQEFFKNNLHSLISVLLLEGIYFYNFTTPEFNVNVCQLPFWALSVLYCWKGLKDNKNIDWLLFGLFAGLGILSKYLFLYLLLAIDIYFIYLLIKKRINFKCLISLITFFLVLTPHLIWLVDNNYTTIYYGLHRTDVGDTNFINHFTYPFIFLGKQIGILIPFILLLLLIVSKVKIKFNLKDKKLIFLLAINILPIILMFLSSLFLGTKIRTMWMTPFYLFFGVLGVYIYQKKISLNKIKYFSLVFLILFIFSPASYYYISVTENNKRTDYPGKKISRIVQTEWEKNFKNEILVVAGDEWHGGNLSYHLKSRPIWDNILNNKKKLLIKDPKSGIIVIGEADILSKICKTVFLKIENQGICMLGIKK